MRHYSSVHLPQVSFSTQNCVAVWKSIKLLNNVGVELCEPSNRFKGFFVRTRNNRGELVIHFTGFLLHFFRLGMLQRNVKEYALDRRQPPVFLLNCAFKAQFKCGLAAEKCFCLISVNALS